MEPIKNDIIVEVVAEVVAKIERRGRKPKENAPSKDPKYFINYYHAKLSQVIQCPKCNKNISKQKLKRHQLTSRCNI